VPTNSGGGHGPFESTAISRAEIDGKVYSDERRAEDELLRRPTLR
jgi:hypothetical protein